jgi:hypothetical protein
VSFFFTEFWPCFAGCYGGVDCFAVDGGADTTGCFDAFTVIVETVGYYCFGAVFVGCYGLRGEGGGVVEFFVVGPVGAAEWGWGLVFEKGGWGKGRGDFVLCYFRHLEVVEIWRVMRRLMARSLSQLFGDSWGI